jgi:hypothetical protein
VNQEAAATLKRLEEQRRQWVTLPNGIKVRYRRPLESEYARFRGTENGIEHVCSYVDGWDGVTEAQILGPEVGASDEVPFDSELWSAYIRDQVEYASIVAQAIVGAIHAHEEAKGRAAKN